MILREMMESLRRIEEMLGRMGAAGGEPAGSIGAGGDEWMQKGIDNILAYQAGKKEEKA